MDRIEKDRFGEKKIDKDRYYGIHTARALENFPISTYKLDREFIKAFAKVKEACCSVNIDLKYINKRKGRAIIKACRELYSGKFDNDIVVDPLQGGAGTSTNMNINEVIANRASEIYGEKIDSIEDVNLHQSTNDVYPTALRVAVINMLHKLEKSISNLQEDFQKKEDQFQSVIKLGRTQLQDALPTTLGITFGAFSEAIARDRWRIFKSRERIKIVPLGGTAIGTGLGAPREYIFKTTQKLQNLTGIVIARGENLVDTIQNWDPFVEISGMLKAYSSSLLKISSDLRLLSSGPYGGIGEITLPPVQTGSSIMPGKVNPVIPEAVTQVALKVMANDYTISLASGMGQLDLNHLAPLIAFSILESLSLLKNITDIFSQKCVKGIVANRDICYNQVIKSEAIATILVPLLGYKKVEQIVEKARENGLTVYDVVLNDNIVSKERIDSLLSPSSMYKLGFTNEDLII